MNNDFDVVVAGGGTSGLVAAVSAARLGARVLLIERYGFLGGTLIAALVGPMMTFHSPSEQVIRGVAQEIVDRLVRRGASPGHIYDTIGYVPTVTPFDAEALKQVGMEMCREAGVRLLFHAAVVEVDVSAGRIETLRVQAKEGLHSFRVGYVVDASGDGDVAALSGVPCSFGRANDNLAQPATLIFKMTHVDTGKIKEYVAKHPEEFTLGPQGVEGFCNAPLISVCGFFDQVRRARAAGELSMDRDRVLFFNTPYPDEVVVNMTRVSKMKELTSSFLSHAEVVAREQVEELVRFFRRRIPGFESARLTATGAQIGLRETRRINGLYTITRDDVVEGRLFEDAIARNAYPIDMHSPDGDGVKTVYIKDGGAYTIPLRSLLNGQVGNLVVTGRAISTTHEAHASTRLSPVCMAVGQAAGTVAALAVRSGVSLLDVPVASLQRQLIADGADLGIIQA